MDETTTAVTTGAIDTLLSTATKLVEFSGDMLSVLIANPVYAFLFSGTVVTAGIVIIKKFKRVATSR